MNQKEILVVISVVLMTGICVGSGIIFWSNREYQELLAQPQPQYEQEQQEIQELTTQVDRSNRSTKYYKENIAREAAQGVVNTTCHPRIEAKSLSSLNQHCQ